MKTRVDARYSTPVICLKPKPVNTEFAGFFSCRKRHLVFIWTLQARKDAAEAAKPTVNTPEQAKELERQALEKNPVTKLSPEQNNAVQSSTEGKKYVNNTSLDNSEKSDKIKEVGIDNVTGENATIDERKFTEYALNPEKQPDKARAFEMALGYNLKNYESLKKQIREGFKRDNLIGKGSNAQGNKYEMLYEIYGLNGKTAKVLTAWLDDIYDQKDFHLTSLYVDE